LQEYGVAYGERVAAAAVTVFHDDFPVGRVVWKVTPKVTKVTSCRGGARGADRA
jgi:hypothetical protein